MLLAVSEAALVVMKKLLEVLYVFAVIVEEVLEVFWEIFLVL